jgi:Protein of unknown function (DUF2950)
MTPILGSAGVVFQRDLDPTTASRGAASDRFDPYPNWACVDVAR